MTQGEQLIPTYTPDEVMTYLGIFLLNRDYAGVILLAELVYGEEKKRYCLNDLTDIDRCFKFSKSMLNGHL